MNLGILYLGVKQAGKALEQFQEAVKLEPGSAIANSNLAAVLLLFKRYPEGEKAARQSLRFGPSRAKAHYILGMSLVMQNRNADEALHHLMLAAAEFPEAHVAVAQILARRGENLRRQASLENTSRPVKRNTAKPWKPGWRAFSSNG